MYLQRAMQTVYILIYHSIDGSVVVTMSPVIKNKEAFRLCVNESKQECDPVTNTLISTEIMLLSHAYYIL